MMSALAIGAQMRAQTRHQRVKIPSQGLTKSKTAKSSTRRALLVVTRRASVAKAFAPTAGVHTCQAIVSCPLNSARPASAPNGVKVVSVSTAFVRLRLALERTQSVGRALTAAKGYFVPKVGAMCQAHAPSHSVMARPVFIMIGARQRPVQMASAPRSPARLMRAPVTRAKPAALASAPGTSKTLTCPVSVLVPSLLAPRVLRTLGARVGFV